MVLQLPYTGNKPGIVIEVTSSYRKNGKGLLLRGQPSLRPFYVQIMNYLLDFMFILKDPHLWA